MNSHLLHMLITSLILSTSFHHLYFDRKVHPWHHHFFLYFGVLFVAGLGFAWLMYLTEPTGYYP
ncbi:hypothetical protein [Acanthopleuribacter pedis]|uniref:Uncharacterized protein n=1 Tax=Acanthopleuribacter pedis TaxID=442870 RepID=A0A8J7QHK9_9BACT|nr:hypothetical protein [Acanthopleuribacter pedis]MBO1320360.1 hypothetical protein [Acanthopleuribacter pedis]